MINKKLLAVGLTCILISPLLHAQAQEETLEIRSVLQDPIRVSADVFIPNKEGNVEELVLTPGALSAPQEVKTINGSLVLLSSAEADPANPGAQLAGSVRIPSGMKRAIVLLVAMAADSKPPFKMVLVNDSPGAFPGGQSRIVNLTPVEMAVQAGEAKIAAKPGSIVKVPAVSKRDEYNMAQTNFFYRKDSKWVPFTERKLQYLERFRRIFIVHVTPGSAQPTISTILDTAPSKAAAAVEAAEDNP